ncbi:pentatricopeptide repeat-containing protein At3g20730 [Daucus carota subsp. sativus]|uniref:pentatricopeptide repeat-containing protein At3g20730 n=1 Tax=Daucus carota subsp. sativus TaxID=79200 RepID=UPI0007F04460|nr:PREDICTED: pentatricopeptide repeat-containing protein At3g20730-like [Daucus carota subsp. sativus]XP_017254734.1 PREDICTED: pentatricopeptide repeat-containing protein At3g20730-like [Daucus carota subsp. sativus]XP_017254735.1 PREDICTED: pentatricopeptide repeat-containing protein At3g20730-like [Daucus carota subsp. sativus]XP_017254736.1 PREDICTED: pentatricopeptide repeat-containing protein At3g20730-like [Daucus carota subsp. sativus]XP_017254737.1 PREDICTED: pentatricopeptide repeat-
MNKLRIALNHIYYTSFHSDHALYSQALQLCIELRAYKQGRLVHSHRIRNGLQPNLYTDTKLIIFYSKVAEMSSARKVFDEMSERSVVSWTALISGYCQNGDSDEALGVFGEMHGKGVRANQFTYGSVLRACTSTVGLDVGKQIQGCIEKSRFVGNLFVQSALVDFHSKCGKMEDARHVFDEMVDRDVVSWNAMIGGYVVQGFRNNAFLMFQSMLREGMTPDSFSLGSVLKAFGGDNDLLMVMKIHGIVLKLGFQLFNILTGSLIDAYVKCGSVLSANNIYKSMPRVDTVACTALITGYARDGHNCIGAVDLFNNLRRMSLAIDNIILCSMLNISANLASLVLGRQIHAIAVKKYEYNHDMVMDNALIDMYSKSGEINDANQIFYEMEKKNVISWTSLIAGYGKHGDADTSLKLYKKMEHNGLMPNGITFLSLLFACSHNGLTNEGLECFSNMVGKYNILPKAEHYSCMVDLFARGGRLEEAYALICKMKIKPNASLWGSILGACSIHGDTTLGKVAAKHLFDLEPTNSANYVVLASTYAAAGLWGNAWKTRKVMEDTGLKKNAGCSYLQSTRKSAALLPAG